MTVRPDGPGLRCEEMGRLTLPGARPMEAMRTLLWRATPGGIAVLFADGRPFHRIDLGGARSEDVHRCGPDLYRVTYAFEAWPLWRVVWRVDGPAKGYTSTTCLTPRDEASARRGEGGAHEP